MCPKQDVMSVKHDAAHVYSLGLCETGDLQNIYETFLHLKTLYTTRYILKVPYYTVFINIL